MKEPEALHSWLTAARHSFAWHLQMNEGLTEGDALALVDSCINTVKPADDANAQG